MTKKGFLLGSLLFFILTSGKISTVFAVNYGMGISQNDGLVWKCKVCDITEMDNVFGSEWDSSGIFTNLSGGAYMKWEINSIIINSTIASIGYDIWYWDLSNEWGIKDNNSQINIFVNPDDYSPNYLFLMYTSLVPFLLPTPVGEYLGGLSVKLHDLYDQ